MYTAILTLQNPMPGNISNLYYSVVIIGLQRFWHNHKAMVRIQEYTKTQKDLIVQQ